MNTERQLKVREYNALRREVAALSARLEKMEAHEGDDGCPEDVEGQCQLGDQIAAKQRRVRELKKEIYP